MNTQHDSTRHNKTTSTIREAGSSTEAETPTEGLQSFQQEPESNILRKTPVREYPYAGSTEKTKIGKYWDKQVMIAWDSEWQKTGKANDILSYQIAVLKNRKLYTQILYPKAGKRLTISDIVLSALEMASAEGLLPKGLPKDVHLFGHWTTADMRALDDFNYLKRASDGLRGSFVTLKRPIVLPVDDKDRDSISVHIRDTKLLAPAGKQSLEALGVMIGVPKVKLPEGAIEQMGTLMEENPGLFEEYAERDPIVTVIYARKLVDILSEYLWEHHPFPVALGGVAEIACLTHLVENKVDWKELLGLEVIKETVTVRGVKRTRTRTVPKAIVDLHEKFGVECFHGGRNETYQYGASEISHWSDFDLVSAYPTALSTLGMPEWEKLRHTTDVEDFTPGAFGFALVKFSFPKNFAYPCLPVRTEKGLIFPLNGEGFCTASEIHVARMRGAEVLIQDGIIIPCTADRPFQGVFQHLIKKRNSYEKYTLGNLLFKETSNSIYGKMAQGLKRKRVFDTRDESRNPIPPSVITNPFIAAYTTGLVRATLAEIMNNIPADKQVISATTDGFITNADGTEIALACSGPCAQLYLKAANHFNDGKLDLPIEVKREAKQILAWRRRGQATLQAGEGTLILAKAGLKAPTRDTAEQNRWIIDCFKTRVHDTKFTYSHIPTLYELYIDEERDLVSYEKTQRLNMDFDFCRKPSGLETRAIESVPHVFFTSAPWNTADEAVRASKDWAEYSASRCFAMRGEQDLRDFLEWIKVERRPSRKRALPIKVAMRTFLQAYMGNHFGLTQSFHRKRNQELSDWLNTHGYKVKVSDVENAKRDARPDHHYVPKTPETLKFVEVIKQRWPSFQDSQFFAVDADI